MSDTQGTPNPFDRGSKCKHPLAHLRCEEENLARGERARARMVCRVCEKRWNSAEDGMPALLASAQIAFKDLETRVRVAEGKLQGRR